MSSERAAPALGLCLGDALLQRRRDDRKALAQGSPRESAALRLERASPPSAVLPLSWLYLPCPCCFHFRQMCLGPPTDGREGVDQRRAKVGQRVLHLGRDDRVDGALHHPITFQITQG